MTKKEKRAIAIAERVAVIPKSMRRTYKKAVTTRRARASAVKAMCQMCMGWEPGCRKDIRKCTDLACPLYLYRPYRRRAKKDESKKQT